MTQFLKQTHFQPIIMAKYTRKPAGITACGRPADVYKTTVQRERVDCPACLAALAGKERRDAGSL